MLSTAARCRGLNDVARRYAEWGYLLGEDENDQLLKDPSMMKRLGELQGFSEQEKEQVLFTLDAVIREIKNRKLYA